MEDQVTWLYQCLSCGAHA